MRNLPKLKLLVVILALVALLAIPAAANATLTYTKGGIKPKVYIAENNGKAGRIHFSHRTKVESGHRTGNEPDAFFQQRLRARQSHCTGDLGKLRGNFNHFLTVATGA